jgi:UDP-N-acetylmuramate--alanine ligase
MKNNLNNNFHIHFIGIGGIGVSSLARYFYVKGFSVSGSDVLAQNDLKELGISICKGHQKENVPEKTKLVIYSNAILADNPELLRAREIGSKIQSYPEALGDLTKKYFTIAVSGTHGKSTTTAMLSLVMIKAGLDPTVIIGTKLKEFGNINFREGRSKYLLIEADEFKAAFLNYYPKIAVITNIDEDHLDYYKDLENIVKTFEKYVKNNLKGNALILNNDDKNSVSLKRMTNGKVVTYSLSSNESKRINLSVFGKHNMYNALAVFHASREMKINEDLILKALLDFKGSWRRFEEKNVVFKNNFEGIIINDYAHHPTEIKATVNAINEKYPDKKVFLVFQPHQYERTYRLFEKFKEVLSTIVVDKLLITDIYTVKGRESQEVMQKISGKKLAKEVKNAHYVGDIDGSAKYILSNLQGNEIVVIMGAGDIYILEKHITKV